MQKLFESRRFWMLLLDTTISIALHYFGGEDARFLIGALQPVFIIVISAYTVQDTFRVSQ